MPVGKCSKFGLQSFLTVVAVALLVNGGFSVVEAQPNNQSGIARRFQPKTLMSPRKALVDAQFISADEVRNQVSDSELVLGVVVEGQPRAYPINMLTGPAREIINDRIGQTDFAATW
jgi:hypothetical protein